MKLPIGGGPSITLASAQNPESLTVDAGNAYWTNYEADGTGTVKKVPIGGGTVTTLVWEPSVHCIAVDDKSIYWVGYDASGNGTVMKLTPK